MRLALGLGCDRGTPASTIETAIVQALAQIPALGAGGAEVAEVVAVASIDLQADETGLAEVAAAHGWNIRFYPAAALAAVPVPNPSETVRKYTGTPSVSEAAALLVSGLDSAHLVIEKHKLRGPDGRNATVSVVLFPSTQDS